MRVNIPLIISLSLFSLSLIDSTSAGRRGRIVDGEIEVANRYSVFSSLSEAEEIQAAEYAKGASRKTKEPLHLPNKEKGIQAVRALRYKFSAFSEMTKLLEEHLKRPPLLSETECQEVRDVKKSLSKKDKTEPVKKGVKGLQLMNDLMAPYSEIEKVSKRHMGEEEEAEGIEKEALSLDGLSPLKALRDLDKLGVKFMDSLNCRYNNLFHDLPNPLVGPLKKDRVAIVGAGPAGIHMAYLLKRQGIEDVTIFEKSDRVAGKSFTLRSDDNVPEEMGTCYTVPEKYHELRRIAGDDPSFCEVPIPPRAIYDTFSNGLKMGQEDFILSAIIKEMRAYGSSKYMSKLPKKVATYLAKAQLFWDMLKYEVVHVCTFSGGQRDIVARTDKTFKEFLDENRLSSLVPLFTLANTVQGYGFLERIPAFYGLWWNSPAEVNGFIVAGLDPTHKRQPASLLKNGFQDVFEKLRKQASLDVRTHFDIQSINRDKTIKVRGIANGSTREEHEFDFLILTTNLRDSLEFLKDATPKESQIFRAFGNQSNLITTLFSCDVQAGDEAIRTCVAGLNPEAQGRFMSERCTARILNVSPKNGKEHWVAYQYVEQAQKDTREYRRKLSDTLMSDLTSLGVTGIHIRHQMIWPYFSHFDQEGIRKGYPWDIVKMQGTIKTWYAGASCVFESVDDVFEYNRRLVNQLRVDQ